MCGLKLGTETVKKIGKKDSKALCQRDVDRELQLLPCYLHLLFNLQTGVLPQITKEVEFSVFQVAGLGLGTMVHMGFTGKVLHGIYFGLKKKQTNQNNLLKTLLQMKHSEAQEGCLGSSPVSGSHISCAQTWTRAAHGSTWSFPCPCSSCSEFLCRTAWSPCGYLYFCVSLICGCHLVSFTPPVGEGTVGGAQRAEPVWNPQRRQPCLA